MPDTQPEISQEAARAMLAALRDLLPHADNMFWKHQASAEARGEIALSIARAGRAIAAAEGR